MLLVLKMMMEIFLSRMKRHEMFPDRDAGKPKVQMPTRASETAGIWHGKLKSVDEQHGRAPAKQGKDGLIKARDWVKYTVVTHDDIAFTTFSSTDALLARCALEGKETVEVQWEMDSWGGKKIIVIDEVKDG